MVIGAGWEDGSSELIRHTVKSSSPQRSTDIHHFKLPLSTIEAWI
jgi:hypothetical protein